ncbi:hypothetical protein LI221_07815 [Faecalimonas umbilicata]|nr:hypothetical protein [Faecalimonas umbilicata]
MLKSTTEPCLKIGKSTDPFPRSYGVGKVLHAPVGCPVIRIGAENNIIKKKRASVCADALVGNE